jgi:hypothetical protein
VVHDAHPRRTLSNFLGRVAGTRLRAEGTEARSQRSFCRGANARRRAANAWGPSSPASGAKRRGRMPRPAQMKRQARVRLICADRGILPWGCLRQPTRRTESRSSPWLCDSVTLWLLLPAKYRQRSHPSYRRRWLFGAQRDHRIDAGRTLRRNQRRDQRHDRNQRSHRQIGQRVASADAEQRIPYTVSRNHRETERQS